MQWNISFSLDSWAHPAEAVKIHDDMGATDAKTFKMALPPVSFFAFLAPKPLLLVRLTSLLFEKCNLLIKLKITFIFNVPLTCCTRERLGITYVVYNKHFVILGLKSANKEKHQGLQGESIRGRSKKIFRKDNKETLRLFKPWVNIKNKYRFRDHLCNCHQP